MGAFVFAISGEKNTLMENKTQDIKQLVQDYSVGKVKDQTASITSEQLIITNNNESQVTYDLPEDEFFVSIAPNVENTHPCAIHSLTGCQGELVNETFQLYIEDMEGAVVLDETVTSQANGFIDLWLPRDGKYQVTIKHDGKTTQSELSTF
ncbi:CueP family metal-binding protein [Radiobacillus sp. PE A8.2]|uniref:CueP family metal-binding protein n=1 Tax=Radiobacillus sp. PE A8.2 TaxID=3380349 RepID=UPI003890C425